MCPRSWSGPLAVALLVVILAPAAVGAEAATVSLRVPRGLTMGSITLLAGGVDMDDPRLQALVAVHARHLTLPNGQLWVCPVGAGETEEGDPLPVAEERCREEEPYSDPQLSFGPFTSLRVLSNHTLVEEAAATLLAPIADPGPGILLVMVPSADGVVLSLDEERLRMRPASAAASILVEGIGRRGHYNGTDWFFLFEGEGTLGLGARGLHGRAPPATPVRLGPTDPGAVAQVLDARALLELQASVHGPASREPIANATELFREHARVPELVTAAILGRLNGSVGERRFTPAQVALVRVDPFDGTLGTEAISGDAEVIVTREGEAIARGTGSPAATSWWVVAVLWSVALATLVLLARHEPGPPVPPALRVGIPVLIFVAWDLRFATVMGTSGLRLLFGDASAGSVLALIGFELVALVVSAALVLAPLVITASRAAPASRGRWARGAAVAAWFLFVLVLPTVVVAMGGLVARL